MTRCSALAAVLRRRLGAVHLVGLTGGRSSMRRQRHPWMVEGPEQYAFVYSVVLDELAVRALESAP